MTKIIKNFILYKNQHFFSSFPCITLINSDISTAPKLLLIFRRARDSRWLINEQDETSKKLKLQVDHIDPRSQLTQIYFDLQLNPVSDAQPISINPEAADQDANILALKDGTLLLSSFSWYPVHSRLASALKESETHLYGHPDITGCYYIMWGGFTRLSYDSGQHWTKHNYLPELPNTANIVNNKRVHHGGANRGQAIEVNGKLLLPVYATLKGDQCSSCHIYISRNQGKDWQYHSMLARDPEQHISLNETSLLHIKDNIVMAFIRNNHKDDHLFTALSYNSGKTWQDWKDRNLVGHPTYPLKLSDGRILIVYGYRHQPYGIRAHFMDETGQHLIGDEIIIRDDGFCGDVGYPWAVEMPDRKVLVVYYFTQEDGIRHIAGSLLNL